MLDNLWKAVLNRPRNSILQYAFSGFHSGKYLCSDCDCLRFRQNVGTYLCFGGTCCLHLQSQSDSLLRSGGGGQPRGCGQVCICGGSSEAVGGGGDNSNLLHCTFNIELDKWVEPLYNTVFVRLICFNPVCHHFHIIFLTILFCLGTWLHSSAVISG